MKAMHKEEKLIELITHILPESKLRLNKPFETDSEVIKLDNKNMLFSMDEFSAEDMLRSNNPYVLGWNLAIGGISDILACGGIPLFYAHALVIDKKWDEEFIKKFSHGIADVLNKTGTAFIGGDIGSADNWSYTVSVIGTSCEKILMRKGASSGEIIYISGRIGLGNIEAAMKLYSDDRRLAGICNLFDNKFKIRISEVSLIRKYATSCIDTSDGVFNALNTVSQINKTGYMIENIPYLKKGLLLCRMLSIPKMLMFLAEGGEYELLFTVKEEDDKDFLREAKNGKFAFYRLGRITPEPPNKLIEDGKELNLSNLNIRARDYDTVKDYLKDLVKYLGSR